MLKMPPDSIVEKGRLSPGRLALSCNIAERCKRRVRQDALGELQQGVLDAGLPARYQRVPISTNTFRYKIYTRKYTKKSRRDRQAETDRETDKDRQRQTETHRETDTDKKKERKRERERERERERDPSSSSPPPLVPFSPPFSQHPGLGPAEAAFLGPRLICPPQDVRCRNARGFGNKPFGHSPLRRMCINYVWHCAGRAKGFSN